MSVFRGLGGNGVLFAEDFDLPGPEHPAAEPEVIEPVFGLAQMEAGKAAAFDEGFLAGRAALLAEDAVRLRQAVDALSAELAAAQEAARLTGEQAAEEIARLLLASLGAVMPMLCACHGEAEAAAVARAVLPALNGEPEITIRVSPHTGPALLAEIGRIDPDLVARVRMVPTDAMKLGDLRIVWRDGMAIRDGAALWREVAAILLPQGLLADDGETDDPDMKDTRHGD
jgi:hypothetical protein